MWQRYANGLIQLNPFKHYVLRRVLLIASNGNLTQMYLEGIYRLILKHLKLSNEGLSNQFIRRTRMLLALKNKWTKVSKLLDFLSVSLIFPFLCWLLSLLVQISSRVQENTVPGQSKASYPSAFNCRKGFILLFIPSWKIQVKNSDWLVCIWCSSRSQKCHPHINCQSVLFPWSAFFSCWLSTKTEWMLLSSFQFSTKSGIMRSNLGCWRSCVGILDGLLVSWDLQKNYPTLRVWVSCSVKWKKKHFLKRNADWCNMLWVLCSWGWMQETTSKWGQSVSFHFIKF